MGWLIPACRNEMMNILTTLGANIDPIVDPLDILIVFVTTLLGYIHTASNLTTNQRWGFQKQAISLVETACWSICISTERHRLCLSFYPSNDWLLYGREGFKKSQQKTGFSYFEAFPYLESEIHIKNMKESILAFWLIHVFVRHFIKLIQISSHA